MKKKITWNEAPETFQALIISRLGEGKANKIASVKAGTYPLKDAIGYELFKSGISEDVSGELVVRLFPEIWGYPDTEELVQPISEPVQEVYEQGEYKMEYIPVEESTAEEVLKMYQDVEAERKVSLKKIVYLLEKAKLEDALSSMIAHTEKYEDLNRVQISLWVYKYHRDRELSDTDIFFILEALLKAM